MKKDADLYLEPFVVIFGRPLKIKEERLPNVWDDHEVLELHWEQEAIGWILPEAAAERGIDLENQELLVVVPYSEALSLKRIPELEKTIEQLEPEVLELRKFKERTVAWLDGKDANTLCRSCGATKWKKKPGTDNPFRCVECGAEWPGGDQ